MKQIPTKLNTELVTWTEKKNLICDAFTVNQDPRLLHRHPLIGLTIDRGSNSL